MIKLIINPDSQPDIRSFQKPIVVIGADTHSNSDLSLPGETLLPVHVKIQEQDGRFIITNNANDPFVTLNGLPFGKKTLKNNDLIQIGNTVIRFIGEIPGALSVSEEMRISSKDHPSDETCAVSDDKLNLILEKALTSKISESTPLYSKDNRPEHSGKAFKHEEFQESMSFNTEFDVESELEKLEAQTEMENGWNNEEGEDNIEDLLSQVEELEAGSGPTSAKSSSIQSASEGQENIHKASLPQHETPSVKAQAVQSPQVHQNGLPPIAPSPKQPKGSLKDYYLSEFDDESENWNQNKKGSQKDGEPGTKWNWRLISIIGAAIVALLLILGGIFYSKMSAKNADDEIRAAVGVADVAMALTYAQINHINPQNQNWSDPEFLKNNLMAVLSTEYSPVASLDNHGQFSNNSYLLRIYTSNDLSQFLVIAQPAPSLLQWLIPKASILVDSKAMELRRTSDLKAMNRLLLNPTLDGISAMEVSHLVKHGDLIPLSTLSSKTGLKEFNPPKALALIRTDSENLIYNAPRYYHFSESFLKKAQILNESQGNGYEVAMLQQEMLELSKYSNLVLYSAQGMQWAAQAQKAINTFLPNNKLLIAYLNFNSKGNITSSHLLIDDHPVDTAQGPSVPPMPYSHLDEESPIVFGSTNGPAQGISEMPKTTKSTDLIQTADGEVDRNHPLYLQLNALAIEHRQAMLPIEKEMNEILESADRNDIAGLLQRLQKLLKKSEKNYQDDPKKLEKNNAAIVFLQRLQDLFRRYDVTIQSENENLKKDITKLYQEYPDMPLPQFMTYLKAAGLDTFVQEQLKQHGKQIANSAALDSKVKELIGKIDESNGLGQLDQTVQVLAGLLTIEKMPDTKKLIAYQNDTRMKVLERLNDLLMSGDNTLPADEFVAENRPVIANILKSAWVVDPDEFDFYLNEFDLHVQGNEVLNGNG